MAYLDENGLEYFWGKIKDRVSSAVAPKANDADVVHKTGDETVQGVKTFSGVGDEENTSEIIIRNPAVTRGTPLADSKGYTRVILADAEGETDSPFTGRLGLLEVVSPKEGDDAGEHLELRCYKYSANQSDIGKYAGFRAGFDPNGIPYASASATSDDRIDSTDIVTRGYMEASEWNWQKTKKAGAVTFKPVPESDLEPVVNFMFTETPPAEGEKSPENPSTISGVSEVNLTRGAGNVIEFDVMTVGSSLSSIAVGNADGSLTINGTVPSGGGFIYRKSGTYAQNMELSLAAYSTFLPAGTYKIGLLIESGTYTPNSGVCYIRYRTTKELGSGEYIDLDRVAYAASGTLTGGGTITMPEGGGWYTYVIGVGATASFSNCKIRPYLYVDGADISGDVVQANSDYTIQFGDTYYGGSLDVATGVMTVDRVICELDGTEWWSHSGTDDPVAYNSTTGYGWSYCIPRDITGYEPILSKNSLQDSSIVSCTHFQTSSSGIGDGSITDGTINYPAIFLTGNQCRFSFPYSTITALKSYLATQKTAGTPVQVAYLINEPFTVQLTPTQIRSLPALDKYEPRINTVYTDQEAVQVGYQRYANYVDLTTDQVIDGQKTFNQPILLKFPQNHTFIRAIAAGTANRSDALDAVGSFSSNNKRLSVIRTCDKDNSGRRTCTLAVVPNSESMGVGSAGISVELLDIDGSAVPCATAPATLEYEADGVTPRTNGYDIVTRNWIPKDTRIVHTTGNETVSGEKTFTSTIKNGCYPIISSTDTGGILGFFGGTNNSNGARCELYGNTRTVSPGSFVLTAVADSSISKQLYGKPDGTLTWNGQTIQTTSDERLKTTLSEVPDAVLDAWEDVDWGQFQYLDAVKEKGESARLHLGLIAQHVMSVFEKHGLDACAYGILCHEEREATEDEPAVDIWMVRYAEAQAMEACCMRRENARLKKRIADLEEKLVTLELKIS